MLTNDRASDLPTSQRSSTPLNLRTLVLLATVLLLPFPIIVHDFTPHSFGDYNFQTFLFPMDIGMGVLAVLSIKPILGDLRSRAIVAGWGGWLLLAAILTIAFVVHPSDRGLHTLLEMYGAVSIAHTLSSIEAPDGRTLIFGALAGVALIETAWAAAQRTSRSSLGLQRLGEFPKPFWSFGKPLAPQGSMVHIYILAGLALVASAIAAGEAIRRTAWWPWAPAAAAAAAPVGMTYSRAGLLGLLLEAGAVILAAAPPLRRRSVLVAASLLIGAALPAAVWNDGWRARSNQTVTASNAATLTTYRGRLIHEGTTLVSTHPVLGVGPGRYVMALKNRFGTESDVGVGRFQVVHNVPLLAAAEGGLLAGLAVIALLALLGWRALRTGAVATAIYLCYLPFVMLDHFPYSFPQGIVLTGLWLGTLDWLARARNHPANTDAELA